MVEILHPEPEVEVYDLPEAAAPSDLAVAERLLAGILVRSWLAAQPDCPEPLRALARDEVRPWRS